MSDAHDSGNPDDRTAEEAALSARLRHLGERLGEKQPGKKPEAVGASSKADSSAMARGLRLSSELVAGVVVGAALGWGFDRVLGTSPWGFILLLLLGFVAGILNLMRSAGVVAEREWRRKE